MPRSLFEGNIRVDALSTAPADPEALTLTELAAGVALSKAIMRSGFRLSPSGSDTLNEASLEDSGNAVDYGASNYDAAMTLFRYLDATGKSDPAQDIAYELFVDKGIFLWLPKRVGPPSKQAWAAGDVYDLFPVVTDDPQDPTDLTGYVKFVQPLGVQGGVVLRGVVAGP